MEKQYRDLNIPPAPPQPAEAGTDLSAHAPMERAEQNGGNKTWIKVTAAAVCVAVAVTAGIWIGRCIPSEDADGSGGKPGSQQTGDTLGGQSLPEDLPPEKDPTQVPQTDGAAESTAPRAEETEPQPAEMLELTSGIDFNAVLNSDGTVALYGAEAQMPMYLSDQACAQWRDMVDIDASNYFVLGLRKDGTVTFGGVNVSGRGDVDGWTDMKAVSAGGFHSVGLRSDGTVAAAGCNDDGECNVTDWTDIVAISAGFSHTVGLKADGTVVAVGSNHMDQCEVGSWTDIIAVAAGTGRTIGLRSDGTVVVTGLRHGNSNPDWVDVAQCANWTDIVAVDAGAQYLVGLKSDGTVVAVGFVNEQMAQWSDVTAISAGEYHTVGIKADGSTVTVIQPQGS